MSLHIMKPGEDGLLRLPMAAGALLAAPVWEDHHRSTNYLAIIDINPTMPGGLDRRFMNRGKGDCLYIIEQIGVLDAVEFAGDYTTSVGRRDRKRWHGVVTGKTESVMTLKPCDSGTKACLLATDLRAQRDAGAPQVRIVIEEPKP